MLILIDIAVMSVSRVSISLVYGPISMKSGMKVGFRTLTTEKILRPSYLDDRCQGNEKLSQGSDIGLTVLNFCMGDLIKHINLPTKNEQNLPCCSEDRPIATAWQPGSE